LLENKWLTDPNPEIRKQYQTSVAEFRENGLIVQEVPMEEECLKITPNPRRGKNMFVLGMLCYIYSRELERANQEIEATFGQKGRKSKPLLGKKAKKWLKTINNYLNPVMSAALGA